MQHSSPYIKRLWDSRVFGYDVAQLSSRYQGDDLPQVLLRAKQHGIKLLYWVIKPEEVLQNAEATRYGGMLADVKVTYMLDRIRGGTPDLGIASYNGKEVPPDLLSLTLQAGVYSRFATDTHFKKSEYKTLYGLWIKNSITRKKAFEVLVYRDAKKKIKGFISLEQKDGIFRIGLIAVDKKIRGKGIGTRLVHEATRICKARNAKKLFVTTQGTNKRACAFYEHMGFTVSEVVHVYHFWL